MQTATLNYLNYVITVELPDPNEDNTICVAIHRLEGTYDKEDYNSYVDHFQFSAEDNDPNKWLLEALQCAIDNLSSGGDVYFKSPPFQAAFDESVNQYFEGLPSTNIDCDPDDIPF